MNISEPFIKRPVGTALLTIALAMAGCLAFLLLPVSPLPQVDFPTIQVSANLPGASPETMASSVATPLERQFGRIAGVTQMTSSNTRGSTNVVLQFDLNRDINGAARDVQSAINAARSQLPANLPSNPFYRKVNPADAPVMLMAMTSDTIEISNLYDLASSVLQQKISQVKGVGQVIVGGSSLPSVRVELNPEIINKYGIGLDQIRAVLTAANANRPKGKLEDSTTAWEIQTTDQLQTADQYRPLIVAYHNGAPVRLSDIADVQDSVGRTFRAFAMQTRSDLRALVACIRGSRQTLTREEVAKIRAPTLIAVGTKDLVAGSASELAALIPGAQALDIPGRDHMLAVGDKVFKQRAVEFLADRKSATH